MRGGEVEPAGGRRNEQVAAELGIWPQTVGQWRRRFLESRLDGWVTSRAPGAPRKTSDEQVEAVATASPPSSPHILIEFPARDARPSGSWRRTVHKQERPSESSRTIP
ncbi:helix-turn-helix domain-containing protein [Streptomyces africanus]|uniref:helix-turn-helix domain-containing protein n=1 Tax=Streptomyces africanus TaxID=231024 RepID=UPI003CC64CB0